MKILEDLLYTEDHEWIRKENSEVIEGITDYAQSELQDIIYLELPEVGVLVKQGEPIGSIEAVKAVSDLYAGVSGKIVEVNSELEEKPELINKDPYEAGWIVKIEPSHPDELNTLLEPSEYRELIEKEE
ncbi:MAG: glycine cleavage system protein GcvH [candidate division WOR-3 bacterium]|nr:glycine cleavage system protein GcvH [candidate division WOR-3 bacterium]